MLPNPTVQALREVDEFHKNAALIFEDIVASIQQRALTATITTVQAPPDSWYAVWHSKLSEHRRLFIFEFAQKYRFIHMLVKASEEKLRGQGTKYKAVCAALEIDPVFPLVAIWGVFKPRTTARFVGAGEQALRRNWADNTILLGVPDDVPLKPDPSSYAWGATVSVESTSEMNPWYCEGALVRLRLLTDIRDTRDVETLVTDLMSM